MTAAQPAPPIDHAAPTAWMMTEVDLTSSRPASMLVALLIEAVATTLRDHPSLNVAWAQGAIRHYQPVNLAVTIGPPGATSGPPGATFAPSGTLMPPSRPSLEPVGRRLVIGDADHLSAPEIDARLAQAPIDRSAATFSLLLWSEPISLAQIGVAQGQAATLVVTGPTRCLIADGDSLRLADSGSLGLVFDHRVVDGAPVGRFLQALRQRVTTALRSPTASR